MKPQEPIPHNYSIRRLNMIFLWSSLGLLAATVLMVGYDYVRGWKWFQLEFMQMQQDRIEQNLQAAQKDTNQAQLEALDRQRRQNEIDIAEHRNQLIVAQKDLDRWEGIHYRADEDYRFAKANLDAQHYIATMAYEERRPDAKQQRLEFQRQSKNLDTLNRQLQDVTASRDAAKARVDSWLGRIKSLEDKRKDLLEAIDKLNGQLATVEMKGPNFLLSLPMLDFIHPMLQVQQVVIPDMFVSVNYMDVPRVDRCQTCHTAIDRPGWESKAEAARLSKDLQQKLDNFQVPQDKRADTEARIKQLKTILAAPEDILNPWRTHPNLDLFVGSASVHPLLEFGCTTCHHGEGRATEFGRAGHVAASPKMEKRWSASLVSLLPGPWDYVKRHWDYEENPFNEEPMYPRQYYEAGCIKCHSGQMSVDQGPDVTKAEQTVELYGCYACHKINTWRFTDLRKIGPDLNGIAEKTTPEWAFRWISEPHNFRSTTRMPSFFYQRNMIDPKVVARSEIAQNIKFQDAEIHGIVTYLFSKSTHRVWAPPSVKGDAAQGKQLVESVGCLACHVESEWIKDPQTGALRLAGRDDYPLERNYGFNFTGLGTKTSADWIYNWIRNPKNYYPTAPMPSLRLTDQEAADITAYLVTLTKPQFMTTPIRTADPAAVHDLAMTYLVNTMSVRDAEAKLHSMPMQEQLEFLGEKSIEKYGCYSCHNIKGFENLKPIGTELTTEGSKPLHLFDFGFAHTYTDAVDDKTEFVHHNVPSFVYNKVRNPRVYDDNRVVNYNDKLKMPNFHMTQDEARRVTMVVLGLTKDVVGSNRLVAQDPQSRMIEEGRKLVSQHNCRGCHVVDGRGRAIAATIADTNFLPPDLTPEGARAQSAFLFNFLKDPTVMKIRPWLSARMPTFHFTDPEANTLVTFFANEGKGNEFDTSREMHPGAQNVAVGKAVFTMLRCSQCHNTTPVNPENPPKPNVADTTSLAPNLTLARMRLRHDWIPDWIRRPNEIIPNTRMPANFPRDSATGDFHSPLAMAIDTPQFAQYRASLLPYFHGDGKELDRTMNDPVALTEYLRDYIWSIGITQMRSAAPGGEAPPAPSMPNQPGAPAVKTGEVKPVAGSRLPVTNASFRQPVTVNRQPDSRGEK